MQPPAELKILSEDVINAGKRMHEALMLHWSFADWDNLRHKYMAFKLIDGRSDGNLYDTFADAVNHQFDEHRCCFVAFKSLVNGSDQMECARLVQFWRDAADSNVVRAIDPDDRFGGKMPLMTTARSDYYRSWVPAPGKLPAELREILKRGGIFL